MISVLATICLVQTNASDQSTNDWNRVIDAASAGNKVYFSEASASGDQKGRLRAEREALFRKAANLLENWHKNHVEKKPGKADLRVLFTLSVYEELAGDVRAAAGHFFSCTRHPFLEDATIKYRFDKVNYTIRQLIDNRTAHIINRPEYFFPNSERTVGPGETRFAIERAFTLTKIEHYLYRPKGVYVKSWIKTDDSGQGANGFVSVNRALAEERKRPKFTAGFDDFTMPKIDE